MDLSDAATRRALLCEVRSRLTDCLAELDQLGHSVAAAHLSAALAALNEQLELEK